MDTAEKIAHYECFLHLFEQVVNIIMMDHGDHVDHDHDHNHDHDLLHLLDLSGLHGLPRGRWQEIRRQENQINKHEIIEIHNLTK